MKTNKLKSLLSITLFGALVFTSCADLSVQNTNEPTKEAVEGSAENQTKLLAGGFYNLTTAIVSSYGTHPDLMSDQSTSTNNVRRFWDHADEPRLRLNNTTSYSATAAYSGFYGGFNSSIATANLFINNIVNNGLIIRNVDQVDVTDAILAQAYFLRGWSRGYLGLMYDQAFLIDENFVIGEDTPEFADYPAMIDASIADLEQAMTLAASSSAVFNFAAMPNPVNTWDSDEFQDILNTIAARILAGEARTTTEAENTDWQQVLDFAEAGIGGPNALSSLSSFFNNNIGSSGEFANYYADWSNFVVACGSALSSCSGYIPVDVKVIHTLNPDYPVEYPADKAQGSTAALDPATSSDPRLDYFLYTTNGGFLSSTRNPALYSNYFSLRNFANSDWWPAEYSVLFATDNETKLLIAEAQYWLDQTPLAAVTLNNSAAGTGETTLGFEYPSEALFGVDATLSGGHTLTGTESDLEIQFALLREYAVEVDVTAGVGANWFFMRRHDMLQIGTATQFAVPGGELEILGLENYTFGGVSFAGQEGSASGDNSWKTLADRAGLAKRAKYTNSVETSPSRDFPIEVNMKANLSRKNATSN